jgi:hypothetical protein
MLSIMRTTLEIGADLLDEIMKITGERSKTAALNRAMKEYIALKRKEQLLELKGKIAMSEIGPKKARGKKAG